MKIKVLITTSSFNAAGFSDKIDVVYNPYGRRLKESEILKLIKDIQPSGMIAGVEPITRRVLSAATNLAVISRCGAGLDSIDLEAAEELGISVINTPDAPKEAVAELALGMILTVLRNITVLDRNIRKGNWKGPKGILLESKTVGIIGCGRIGSRLAELLTPFRCRLVGHDPALASHEYIEMVGLDELIEMSDIISLHIPLTDYTRNIMSRDRIGKMKKGAVLINTARGGLVDEEALFDALSGGNLHGAALDCFCQEPYVGNLKELDNIVLMPHMGSSTYKTREDMEKRAVENLMSVLKRKGVI